MRDEKEGIPMKMVAVSHVKRPAEREGKNLFSFSFSLVVDVVSFRFCYHIPHNWNFLRMCSLLPPLAVLSLFSFFPVYTKIFLFFFFFLFSIPPRASSVSRSAPSRTTKPREREHARRVSCSKDLSEQTKFWKKGVSQHLHNYFPLFLKEAKYIPSPHWKKPESNLSSQSSFLLSLFNLAAKRANPIKKLYVCVCVIDSINIYSSSCTVLPSRELVYSKWKSCARRPPFSFLGTVFFLSSRFLLLDLPLTMPPCCVL